MEQSGDMVLTLKCIYSAVRQEYRTFDTSIEQAGIVLPPNLLIDAKESWGKKGRDP